jgi:hypothetical protein
MVGLPVACRKARGRFCQQVDASRRARHVTALQLIGRSGLSIKEKGLRLVLKNVEYDQYVNESSVGAIGF